MIACMGVLVFGTLQGIVVAIIVSLIGLFSQIANPRVHVLVDNPHQQVSASKNGIKRSA